MKPLTGAGILINRPRLTAWEVYSVSPPNCQCHAAVFDGNQLILLIQACRSWRTTIFFHVTARIVDLGVNIKLQLLPLNATEPTLNGSKPPADEVETADE